MKNAPLYEFIFKYSKKDKLSFHTPCHGGGRAFKHDFEKNLFSMDITELYDTDNLQEPCGIIEKASSLMSRAYSSKHSFLLTGGSTGGIQAMLLYVSKRGSKIIVDRGCHISVLRMLKLLKITPVFICQKYHKKKCLPLAADVESVEKALCENPDVAAVLITSPNYYGVFSDTQKIANLVRSHKKLLLIDEAHGAHFPFSPLFPKNSMESGAHISVNSIHKTLAAPTGSAVLHISSEINKNDILECINTFHTTSPSYITLAYMDLARAEIEKNGEVEYKELYKNIQLFKKELEETFFSLTEHKNKDFSRVVINCSNSGFTGFEISENLYFDYDIAVEMADLYNIVLITGTHNLKEDFERLLKALKEIKPRKNKVLSIEKIPYAKEYAPAFTLENAKGEKVVFSETVGKTALENIILYPPASAIIAQGDVITKKQIDYITLLKKFDNSLKNTDKIKVI